MREEEHVMIRYLVWKLTNQSCQAIYSMEWRWDHVIMSGRAVVECDLCVVFEDNLHILSC